MIKVAILKCLEVKNPSDLYETTKTVWLVTTPLTSIPAPTLPAGPSEPSGASMGKNPLIPKGLYGFDLPPSISLTPVQRSGDKPEKSSSKKDKESKKDHHSKSDSGKKHDKPKKAKKDKKEKKSHKEKHRSSSPATKEAKKAEKAEKKKAKAEKKAKKDGKAPSFMEEPQLFAPTPSKKVIRCDFASFFLPIRYAITYSTAHLY